MAKKNFLLDLNRKKLTRLAEVAAAAEKEEKKILTAKLQEINEKNRLIDAENQKEIEKESCNDNMKALKKLDINFIPTRSLKANPECVKNVFTTLLQKIGSVMCIIFSAQNQKVS